MTLSVKFHDYAAGALGTSSTPLLTKLVEQIGATHERTCEGYLTFDNSYPTGGYALSASALGLTTVAGVLIEDSAGYSFVYNRTTGKVQAYSAANTEVANATNLSALQPAYFKAYGVV